MRHILDYIDLTDRDDNHCNMDKFKLNGYEGYVNFYDIIGKNKNDSQKEIVDRLMIIQDAIDVSCGFGENCPIRIKCKYSGQWTNWHVIDKNIGDAAKRNEYDKLLGKMQNVNGHWTA